MYNKIKYIVLLYFSITALGISQNCNLKIKGQVLDEGSQSPLSFVNVVIQELGIGATTDDEGRFELKNICDGDYHLIISHIGCESEEVHVHLHEDYELVIELEHGPIHIEDIEISGQNNSSSKESSVSISKRLIEDNSNKNLSSLLETQSGVYSIKNGNGIAKPVVHGLYGNRLVILNNGIAQSGQQWGNDHSPEIDPLVANRITVIKGTSTVEYATGNMGSIVLIQSRPIKKEPHLHGRVNYAYETNGRGNNFNVQLQKHNPELSWRLTGTLKKYGDRQTPDYFLNNTGVTEQNAALQVEKPWTEQFSTQLYFSSFNSSLGILRGSHIGNLTDLESALSRDVPFFTEENFSYDIDAPRQRVSHHLFKADSKYFFSDNEFIQFIVATQINDRKEFDVRRSGRSDIPALSLTQWSHTIDIKYQMELDQNSTFKFGHQSTLTDNTNNPETGILPLIPDYFSYQSGAYFILTKRLSKVNFSFGSRYDHTGQNVALIGNSIPREIIRYDNRFNNFNASFGSEFIISKNQALKTNIGLSQRNPAINELYSSGLHQGVSGIEEGNILLESESAIKLALEYSLQPNSKFSFESQIYAQRFKDYIYLQPTGENRLTIRGAFPVFEYKQTDALIYGLDLSTQYSITNSIFAQLRYNFLRGNDLEEDLPLLFMPPNNLYANFIFRSNNPIQSLQSKFEDFEIEWSHRYVFRQNHLEDSQDFTPAPDAYYLMGIKLSANFILPKYKLRFFAKIDNALNSNYRDYLNRQRYFADDLGWSVTAGFNFEF